ncbi:MAG: ribosome maturation factor RimP [Nitrospinaceae bacterium]|nr:MAG: ribosome maturation factor RimP [Nitrospinaceae bacterium]
MTKTSITESIIGLIEPVIQEESLELVDVEYKKLGKTWTLRVYIDNDRGITVDDCQKISRQIEDMIEIDDLIANPFVLEVSSPGLDRPLKKVKDFLRYKGKSVEVKTFSPIENRREFHGIIQNCKDEVLSLKEEEALINIPLDKIAKAKLIIEF